MDEFVVCPCVELPRPARGARTRADGLGSKAFGMFAEPVPAEREFFDEQKFDALVEQHSLAKGVGTEFVATPDGGQGQLRRVLYAQPAEAWRILSRGSLVCCSGMNAITSKAIFAT